MPAEGHVFKHVSYLGKVTHSLENTVSSKSSWWGTWHRPSSQGAYGIPGRQLLGMAHEVKAVIEGTVLKGKESLSDPPGL